MDLLIAWFNGLGWLANALALLTAAIGIGAFIWRWKKKISGIPKSFTELVESIIKTSLVPPSLKQVGQIAIVDDKISDFPVAELKRAGYNIKTYKHVSVSEFDEISKFDIVFLDMLDIVKDDPTEGGLKLIQTLRDKNSRQRICAVSSKKFDPSATAFFKKADDAQNKPMNAQKCVQVIDAFLSEKLDPKMLARELDMTTDLPSAERRSLLAQLSESASTKAPLVMDRLPSGLTEKPRSLVMDLSRVLAV